MKKFLAILALSVCSLFVWAQPQRIPSDFVYDTNTSNTLTEILYYLEQNVKTNVVIEEIQSDVNIIRSTMTNNTLFIEFCFTNGTGEASIIWDSQKITDDFEAEPNQMIFADTTLQDIVITLPPANTTSGLTLVVRKEVDLNIVWIQAVSSNVVHGTNMVGLSRALNSLTFVSDGTTNWAIQ